MRVVGALAFLACTVISHTARAETDIIPIGQYACTVVKGEHTGEKLRFEKSINGIRIVDGGSFAKAGAALPTKPTTSKTPTKFGDALVEGLQFEVGDEGQGKTFSLDRITLGPKRGYRAWIMRKTDPVQQTDKNGEVFFVFPAVFYASADCGEEVL